MEFPAEYEKAKSNTFIADPIGSKGNLTQQFNQYKRYIFRNYMGKNQDTGEYWTTKQIILDLLLHKDKLITDWLTLNSELCYIMKAFLDQVTESSVFNNCFQYLINKIAH